MSGIYLVGRGLICASGAGVDAARLAALAQVPRFTWHDPFGPIGKLAADAELAVAKLSEGREFKHQDRGVILGVLAAREAWQEVQGQAEISAAETAVVFGSARGAAATLEREHDRFLGTGKVAVHTSPQTTLGTFAAAVGQDLRILGPSLAVSNACVTGLQAVGVASAMLQSGQVKHAVAGAAEACLTPFVIAQLTAAQVLAKKPSALFPCRPFHPERSGLVLGEGAAAVVLTLNAPRQSSWTRILGYGASTEQSTATGVSEAGEGLTRAIHDALDQAELVPEQIDLIVGHGSSTVKGDAAEMKAYESVFTKLPLMTFHKWLFGHILGASPVASLILAEEHLRTGEVPALPYYERGMVLGSGGRLDVLRPRRALVTALGFGGQAAALVLEVG